MAKWEYCKIVQPVIGGDGDRGPTKLAILSPSKDETRTKDIDDLNRELARLGVEGWELVSHTQVWGVVEAGITTPAPLMEVYYLKREIEEEPPSGGTGVMY